MRNLLGKHGVCAREGSSGNSGGGKKTGVRALTRQISRRHVDLIPVKNDGGTVDTCLTNVGGRGLTVSSIAGPYLGDRECGTINCRDS